MSTQIQGPQARDLSPEEQQMNAERAFELNEKIKAGLKAGRMALWQTAEPMLEFEEMRGWLALGYENITEWLADPEIQVTRSTFYRAVSSFKYLVGKGVALDDMADLEVSKVEIVLPKVKRGEKTLRKALEDARSLGARDLRETYLARVPTPNVGSPDNGDIDGSATEVDDSTEQPPVDWDDGTAPEPFEAPSESDNAATNAAEFIVTNTTVGAKQAYELAPGLVAIISGNASNPTSNSGSNPTSNGGDVRQKAIDWLNRFHDEEKAFNRIPTKFRHEAEQILLDAGLLG